jgi:peroxiredoxin
MSLQNQLNALKERLERSIPPEALAIMHGATADLQASGQESRIVGNGATLPPFELPDQEGKVISSSGLIESGPLVLTFYRGLWCPYCNIDLAAMKAVHETLQTHGGQLLAISPELPAYSRQIIAKQKLPFPILHDHGNGYAAQLGLRFPYPADLKRLYQDGFGIDLTAYHGDDSWTLPMPARYLIDQAGIIRFAEAKADYTDRPDPAPMLALLDGLA